MDRGREGVGRSHGLRSGPAPAGAAFRLRAFSIRIAATRRPRARRRAWRNAMAVSDPKSDRMGNVIGAADGSVAGLRHQPQVAYTDLREWIEEARKLGEIREVKGLSWQKDIGMASEVILHDENAPCVIFEDVPGTLPGSRVLVNFFGGKRQKHDARLPDRPDQARAERGVPHPLHGRPQAHPAALRQRRPGVREHRSPATPSTSPSSRRRNGTRTTAAATSAPAAST